MLWARGGRKRLRQGARRTLPQYCDGKRENPCLRQAGHRLGDADRERGFRAGCSTMGRCGLSRHLLKELINERLNCVLGFLLV